MSTIFFRCPGCNKSLKTSSPALAGKKIRCPKCGGAVPVPASGEAAKAPASPDEARRAMPKVPESDETWSSPAQPPARSTGPGWGEEEPPAKAPRKAPSVAEELDFGSDDTFASAAASPELDDDETILDDEPPSSAPKAAKKPALDEVDIEDEPAPRARGRKPAAEDDAELDEAESEPAPAKKGLDVVAGVVTLIVILYVGAVALIVAGVI